MPFGWRLDRAAVFFEGHLTGWVYPGETPEIIRDAVVGNRMETIRFHNQAFRMARQALRRQTVIIETTGRKEIVSALRYALAQLPGHGDDSPDGNGRTAGASTDKPPAGRRPRTNAASDRTAVCPRMVPFGDPATTRWLTRSIRRTNCDRLGCPSAPWSPFRRC